MSAYLIEKGIIEMPTDPLSVFLFGVFFVVIVWIFIKGGYYWEP